MKVKDLDLLIINPPVVRPAEPPLGPFSLSSNLTSLGLGVTVEDINARWFSWLLREGTDLSFKATPFQRRAIRRLKENLDLVTDSRILKDFRRYGEAVLQLLSVIKLKGEAISNGSLITFTDFRVPGLSPLSSLHLRSVALTGDCGPMGEFLAQETERLLAEFRPKMVGVSLNYLSQALPSMAIVGHIRRIAPSVKTVLGGALVSIWGPRVYRNPNLADLVDLWIEGPADLPLAKILGSEGVPPKGPCSPGTQSISWHLYLSPQRIYPVSLSRGCYWGRWRFCLEGRICRNFESLDVERLPFVVQEAARVHEIQWVHFTDSALTPRALRALSEMELGVRWYGFARFEPVLSRIPLASALRKSGCRMLQLGLESGSQRILDALGKGFHLETASAVLRNLHEAGVGVYLYVMFGTPGETVYDALRTLDFVESHADCIDFMNISLLNLPIDNVIGQDGLEMENVSFPGGDFDLALYTNFRARMGMDRREARTFMERRFKRSPLAKTILRRDPPCFTSSHAALFLDYWGERDAYGGGDGLASIIHDQVNGPG
jgi:hypothetical protein